MPVDLPQQPQPQPQPQQTNIHTTSPLRTAIQPGHDSKGPASSDGQRGRGRGRGRARGRGRGTGRHSFDGQHPSSLSTTAASSPSNRNTRSPDETPTRHAARDTDADGVIRIEDLVERGAVSQLQQSPRLFEIPGDLLATGRSSITIGAAVGGDKRRFNLKWLYDYPWLRFDPQPNAMLCTLCTQGQRANQFAKKGSRNFKTSALVDHSSSNDHQRSVAQFGELPRASSLVLAMQDGAWAAIPSPREQGVAQQGQQGADSATESKLADDVSSRNAPAENVAAGPATPIAAEQATGKHAIVSSSLLAPAATSHDPAAMQLDAPQSMA
ncbi:hypothetical protein IWW51_005451, partial [Coemansia sp. RSA 2702]